MTKKIFISTDPGMAIISFLQELNHFDWQKRNLMGLGAYLETGAGKTSRDDAAGF